MVILLTPDIRTLKFEIECPNNLYAGMNNRYDNFQGI